MTTFYSQRQVNEPLYNNLLKIVHENPNLEYIRYNDPNNIHATNKTLWPFIRNKNVGVFMDIPTIVNSNTDQVTGGIPWIAQYFKTFDPINITSDERIIMTDPNTLKHEANYSEFIHLKKYLDAAYIMGKPLLQNMNYDCVIYAIVTYALRWSSMSKIEFTDLYPTYASFIAIINDEMSQVTVCQIMIDGKAYPYLATSVRVLKRYLFPNMTMINPILEPKPYDLIYGDNGSLYSHICQVATELYTNQFWCKETITLVEDIDGIKTPFKHLMPTNIDPNNQNRIKYLTGQACCGKTTLLNEFIKYNWNVRSRGELGSYGGKAKAALPIASLHAALDSSLSLSNTIGDRGPIDNPLWTIIMAIADPKFQRDPLSSVNYIFSNFLKELSDNVVRYHMSHKVVVVIDPYPEKNRLRMLERFTGGDALRARINLYPYIQAIAYYTVARLYRWPVYCVPYTENETFDVERYTGEIIPKIIAYFGTPKHQPIQTLVPKVPGYGPPDHTYANIVGIAR